MNRLSWMSVPLAQYTVLLATYLQPLRPQLVGLALLIFAGTALQLLNPLVIRSFIDTAANGGALRDLLLIAVAFIAIALLYQGLAVAQASLAERTAWQATNALRTALTRHCLHLDMAFHNSRTPGELTECLDGDVAALSNFFSQFAIVIVANGLLLLGILITLFWEDWRIGMPLLLFVLFAFWASSYVHALSMPYWPAARAALARLLGFLEERLSATEDLRANGATAYMMLGLYRHLRERLQTLLRAYLMMVATFCTSLGLMAFGSALALGIGAYLFQQNAITVGTVYLIFHYTRLLIQPVEFLMLELMDLQKATASIGRIEELFALPSERLTARAASLPPGPLPVEFQAVAFRYHAETPDLTLRDISFQLQPGELLGLAGRTGSGKTTVTRLLARLYEPTTGSIKVGGVDIHQVDPVTLRRNIGLVTQDVQLFQATVRENLTFFDPTIADDRILTALHSLGLWTWYLALPNGLDTPLAAGGGGLSAGEAQLLAFTRVLLKDPGLVILDEASSRLDPLTERLIDQAVTNLLGNGQRTGIIIAHHLATLQRVDTLMLLENGRIVEYGRRAQLAADPTSRFYQLLQTGAGLSTREVLA
ncbi:MAG: ABC transporter ATP-binding protein [Caldilineaceae bacterium]